MAAVAVEEAHPRPVLDLGDRAVLDRPVCPCASKTVGDLLVDVVVKAIAVAVDEADEA